MMRGLTCHPIVQSVCMNGLYLVVLSLCVVIGNLSWQYANSMNCMTCVAVRGKGGGGCVFVGAPCMHSMYGRSFARHVHVLLGHVHWSSHCGIVLSCGMRYWLPTFMSA
jgi:hypothetical protein